MKLEPPKNPNYAATVTRVMTLLPLEGCDNLLGLPLFGYQAIVGKDTKVGDLGILFPAECQLSDEYVKANNLYRHETQNEDQTKKGYLEDNRRVKSIQLRGHRSDALFMPIDSLAFLFQSQGDFLIHGPLQEGDSFDMLEGHEICRKYERPRAFVGGSGRPAPRAESRVSDRLFPEQFYITNFFRVDRNLDPKAHVVVTQKLHGTSLRVGNVLAARKLSFLERLGDRFGLRIQKTEYAMVYGSHHVIKSEGSPDQRHFYETDLWSRVGHRLDGRVPENYVVYAEIIGFVPGTESPIQKHYTYDQPRNYCEVYVYRVAVINQQGVSCDLSWDAVKEFCVSAGLYHVPELWSGPLSAFHPNDWLDVTFHPKNMEWTKEHGYPQAVQLSPDSPCDEGVCVRIEGSTPQIYKVKSPLFLGHETKMLDQDVPDIEATEGTT